MEYLNHKIAEAVCAFRFNPELNPWDITLFAEYYNLISDIYTKKQEVKPFEVKLNINPEQQLNRTDMKYHDISMVFKNEKENYAILLGNNYISFHTLNHYPGWEVFNKELINEYLGKYFSMGLGKGLLSAQMIYINTFQIEKTEKLSDYLVFVPEMENFGEGDELSHFFQSAYNISPNKILNLRTILNVNAPERLKKITLECNCIANNIDNSSEWANLSKDAHDAAKNAFIKISSDYFKNIIK